jgi:penicillin-binding protein 1A
MKPAVAGRPVEAFETEVTLPEWQIEPDQEAYGEPDNAVYVDEDGNPVDRGQANPEAAQDPGEGGSQDEGTLDQDWLDRMTGRQQQPQREAPAPRRDPADRPPREPSRAPQESRPNE